jgi:hypothetical protein
MGIRSRSIAASVPSAQRTVRHTRRGAGCRLTIIIRNTAESGKLTGAAADVEHAIAWLEKEPPRI